MKKFSRIIAFILIQFLFISNLAWGAGFYAQNNTYYENQDKLSPEINIGLSFLRDFFQDFISHPELNNDFLSQTNKISLLKVTENKTDSNEEFFYSESLGAYLSRKPLKVDAYVLTAATELGIKLDWDDSGRIGAISFYDTKRLLKKLGLELMSHLDYWRVLKDACAADDKEMIKDLLSDKYAEWLDVIFIEKGGSYYMIEHPTINDDGTWDESSDKEKMLEINMPEARHAWFSFEENFNDIYDVIDQKLGFPYREKVEQDRPKTGNVFKFWDMYTDLAKTGVGVIRGYVTSSGTPSLDCAMPLNTDDAPLLMVRTLCKELPKPPIDRTILEQINIYTRNYDQAMEQKEYEQFYKQRENFIELLSEQLTEDISQQIRTSRDNSLIKIREKLADIAGFLNIYANVHGDKDFAHKINSLSLDFFGVDKSAVNYQGFKDFICSSRQNLVAALKPQSLKPIVFVMGHKAPDTDTVISSLFEAYRNHLLNPEIVSVPVVQAEHLPDEVKQLLDDQELADAILMSNHRVYQQAYDSGQANWVLVDQNVSEVQKFVISILDHHSLSKAALESDVAKTIEIAGSTTAMVVQRFKGMGLEIPRDLARICYGATLMDTENKNKSKMTVKDKLLMDILREQSGIEDTEKENKSSLFYQDLMSQLLNTNDAEHLFKRDYKQDWGFGFAVAKMKRVFDRKTGELIKTDVLERMLNLAEENNAANNFPVTLIKIVDYEEDNEIVFKERLYFVFNLDVSSDFKQELLKMLNIVIKKQFPVSSLIIKQEEGYIEWQGVGKQLSRKKIAPVLQPIVDAFNKYFYSQEFDLFVRRDFLRLTDQVRETAAELNIELSANEEGYVNFVSAYNFMRLMRKMGNDILSLKEYSIVRKEAKQKNDKQMLNSLESHGFAEVLDTLVFDYNQENESGDFIEHPYVQITSEGEIELSGDMMPQMHVPYAAPGLFDWDNTDKETGLPAEVFYFGDDISHKKGRLSRYWSPKNSDTWVFTRGSIFIYQIPCMDGKVRPDEMQANLGVRACRTKINKPQIINIVAEGSITTQIIDEEGVFTYKDGQLQKNNELPFKDISAAAKKELRKVDSREHGLELDVYLAKMIPQQVINAFRQGDLNKVELHYAPLEYLNKKNEQLLAEYQDISLIDPDGCLIGWYIKIDKNNKSKVIITNVRGVSKRMHMLYALELLGMDLNYVSVYDYDFNYESFAKQAIAQGLSGQENNFVAIGKSVFGRKILRKIKFGRIYQQLKKDMQDSGEADLKQFLQTKIKNAVKDPADNERLIDLFAIPFVRDTMKNMLEILNENLAMQDLLTYWYYGDITEDFVRIIKTLNTGEIEITKFVKMLQPELENVRLSETGVLIYEQGKDLIEIDLAEFINVKDKRIISFKPQIDLEILIQGLSLHPQAAKEIGKVFEFTRMFADSFKSPLAEYADITDLKQLEEKFNVTNVDADVMDINVLNYPVDDSLKEVSSLAVASYPFGTLAADYVSGAIENGARTYIHAGSCGIFIDDLSQSDKFNLRPGDLIIPEEIYDKNGNFLTYLNSQKLVKAAEDILQRSKRPYRILKKIRGNLEFIQGVSPEENPDNLINIIITRHVSVDTPLEEDIQYMSELKDMGMGSVDCETAKVVERMLEKRVYFDYEFMFWVSDVPGKSGATLAAEKDLHPINHDTRMRKVQGLMSDIFMYLRLQENSQKQLDLEQIKSFSAQRKQFIGTVEDAIAEIEKRRAEKKNKFPEQGFKVLISGISAAGKTSRVAKVICDYFHAGEILSQDHYYLGRIYMDKHGLTNYDDPRCVELSLYVEHLRQADKGLPFMRPIYAFTDGGTRVGEKEFQSNDVIVGEGNFSLVDGVAEEGDFNIFVTVVELGQMLRRIKRDVIEGRTGQTFREALHQLFTQVLPAQKEFLEPTAKNADMIIYSYYDPQREAVDIGTFELQAKVKIKNQEALIRLEEKLTGAEKIGEGIIQNDIFYTPKDRNLLETTGEILRLRDQNNKLSLTYKGPLMPSKFRNKPKMEMPFDKELIPYMEKDYQVLEQVKKTRNVYRIGDVIINFDQVDGLGCFIEVSVHQTQQGEDDEIKIQQVLQKLGLGQEKIERESYLELKEKQNLSQKIKTKNDIALVYLKGGKNGGLNPEIKEKILAHLSQWFDIAQGDEHKVSFNEMIERWGKGYFYHHFLKKIEANSIFSKEFVRELSEAFDSRDESRFNAWMNKARQIAQDNDDFKMQLMVYEYYSDIGQQLLLKLKPGISLNTQNKSLQAYVKDNIIGPTFCYDADLKHSRGIIKESLQAGVLRPFMRKVMKIYGQTDEESERFISSIFNGIHRADYGPELDLEFNILTNKDVVIFNNALKQWELEGILSSSKMVSGYSLSEAELLVVQSI